MENEKKPTREEIVRSLRICSRALLEGCGGCVFETTGHAACNDTLYTVAADLIDQLTEYRAALAERYAALATAAYRDRLELTRDPGYRGKPVIYFVRIVRTYEDGTTERVLDEKYFGTERRKAFARFAELKHQRPGIETMQDTEKRSWER